jgi:hypothetical protein
MIERTRMFSEEPLDAGAQRADAAHDQVDLHAGLRRFVKRIDDSGSSSEFILAMMRERLPALARGGFGFGTDRRRARSVAARTAPATGA